MVVDIGQDSDGHGSGFYDRTGEYVAVLLPAAWEGLGPALAAAVTGLDVTAGPVVDVGAGTGIGTEVLARALPGAEILAVEPHAALRTALLARLSADDDLRERATVLDTDLLAAALPDTISAMVLMNVIGHFTPADRQRIWALLATRLAPTGRAVLNLYPPTRPEPVTATPMGQARIGRRRYTGTATAEPAGQDAVTWAMTYRIDHDGETVTELTATDHWYVFTPEQLATELADHGLQVTAGDPAQGIQIITPACPAPAAAGSLAPR